MGSGPNRRVTTVRAEYDAVSVLSLLRDLAL